MKNIEANLIRALPEVLEQLDHKFFVKTITFEGIQRIETPPYPKAALREVFLNAMVHRLLGPRHPEDHGCLYRCASA